MKTVGLLGGMSWESTQSYYRLINENIKQIAGGLHSAKVIINSLDFAEIEPLMRAGSWDEICHRLTAEAQTLELAHADCILICTNTMHKIADSIQEALSIPLLHIADATAEVLQRDNRKTVGLLGTAYTMEQDFYRQRIENLYSIEVIVPEKTDREIINRIIFEELCQGIMADKSRQDYLRIINALAEKGAEAIVLGCTEISMLISQKDTDIPLYDTLTIHASKAVEFALLS